MSASHATVDLDDAEGLIAADRDGLLRAAAMAGAQVRATAAAVEEGALESVRGGERPRTVVWVAGRGTAEAAGAMLASAFNAAAAEPIVVTPEAPTWLGPLDVLIVAGDDPGDPTLVAAAGTGVRRGARVVVVAPYEGPLRDTVAGRAAVLEPRLAVSDEFGLCRYLAAGLAVLHSVNPGLPADLATLADELDAEALRNSVGRDVFTNPAKALAERIRGRAAALVGDCAATLALARHGSAAMLRIAHRTVAAAGLADAVTALRAGVATSPSGPDDALFYDAELDGPLTPQLRVMALALAAERTVVAARVAGLADIDVIGAEDVPDLAGAAEPVGVQRPERQLAVLATRLEMAAVYLRLVWG